MFDTIKHMPAVRSLYRKVFNLNAGFIRLVSTKGRMADAYISDDVKNRQMMIVTVAFNHIGLIEKQIELVKRYVRDKDYCHVIADNSPSKEKRASIKALCEAQGVSYVPVPRRIERCCWHRFFWGGISHGGALNWLFYKYLPLTTPHRFALLDHDVFPLTDVNLMLTLGDREFYGVSRIKEHGWYLWPGWCIFNYQFMKEHSPNFLPVYAGDSYLDSGGHNYFQVYQSFDFRTISFPKVMTHRIKNTKGLARPDQVYHNDCIQIIADSWIHLINGSNCAHTPGKERIVETLLQKLDTFKPILQGSHCSPLPS